MNKSLSILLAIFVLAGCAPKPGILDENVNRARIVALPEEKPGNGSLYMETGGSLFDDIRANRRGDILVVSLVERTDAVKSSSTNVSRSSSVDVGNPVLGGETREIGRGSNLGFNLDSDSTFAGGSDSDQSNSLTGTIAVTVTEVLPGGNLLVEGEKWLSLNRGREFIRLRGIVRPVDIDPSNTVPSTRIANAEITYSGTGAGADANSQGWLSRFFIGKIWPF